MSGAIPLLPFIPSWHGNGQVYLKFHSLCFIITYFPYVKSTNSFKPSSTIIAIQCFLFQCSVSPVFLKVIQQLLVYIQFNRLTQHTQQGPNVSGLTHKSRAKWKMLRGIYSAIYELLVHRCEKCVETEGDYVEKQQICFISVTLQSWPGRKLLDPTTYMIYQVTIEWATSFGQ